MADLANEGRWPGPGGGIAVVTVMGKKRLSGARGNEMLWDGCFPDLQWPSGDRPVHQNWRAGYGQAGQRERPPGPLGGEDEDVL